MEKTSFLVYIFLFIAGILASFLVIRMIDNAIVRHEQNECRIWQQQAIDFADAGFYLAAWQEAQCEAVGYPVKVKNNIIPRKDFEQ